MDPKEKPERPTTPDDPTRLRIDPLTALACQNLAVFPYPISPGMPAINPFNADNGLESEDELKK